jgi:hypothetical protein
MGPLTVCRTWTGKSPSSGAETEPCTNVREMLKWSQELQKTVRGKAQRKCSLSNWLPLKKKKIKMYVISIAENV